MRQVATGVSPRNHPCAGGDGDYLLMSARYVRKNASNCDIYSFSRARQHPPSSVSFFLPAGDAADSASPHMRFTHENIHGGCGLFIDVCVVYFRKNAITSSIYAFLLFRQLPSASVPYCLLAGDSTSRHMRFPTKPPMGGIIY